MSKFDPLFNYKHRGSLYYFSEYTTMVNTPTRVDGHQQPASGSVAAAAAAGGATGNGAGNLAGGGAGLQPDAQVEGPPILDNPTGAGAGSGIVGLAPPGVNVDNVPPHGGHNHNQMLLFQQQQHLEHQQANHQAQLRHQVQQVADLQAQMGFMSIQNPAQHGFLPQNFPVADPVQIPIFSLPRSGRPPINPLNFLGLSDSLPRLPISVPGHALQQAAVQPAPGQPPDPNAPFSSFQVQNALTKLAMDNQVLFQAKQEREVAAIVAQFSNPMSKRSVEHNMRLGHTVEELVTAITPHSQLIIAHAGNLDQVNSVLQIVGSSAQLLRDRLSCDSEKHLIAKTSSLGWKLVQSLEGLEGSLGKISMSAIHTQEKAYLSHQQALSSVAKTTPAGVGGNRVVRGGGRGGSTAKVKGKGRGKSNNSSLKGTKTGGVGKPKKGSCYRCGGSHFYRNCPHPPITPTE
jgi:hypothetical protein